MIVLQISSIQYASSLCACVHELRHKPNTLFSSLPPNVAVLHFAFVFSEISLYVSGSIYLSSRLAFATIVCVRTN